MNYQDGYSFNRASYSPMQGHALQHNYVQYQAQPKSQLAITQMSQMSQEPIDLRNQYSAYDYSQSRGADRMHSLSFKNLSLQHSNLLMSNHETGFDNSNQHLQADQADIETLVSPIILRAMAVLKECELNPHALQDLAVSLKQKLYTLKKVHKSFNQRMEELIKIAQDKQEQVKKLFKQKARRQSISHSRSRSNIKQRPADHSQNSKIQNHKKRGPKPKQKTTNISVE